MHYPIFVASENETEDLATITFKLPRKLKRQVDLCVASLQVAQQDFMLSAVTAICEQAIAERKAPKAS